MTGTPPYLKASFGGGAVAMFHTRGPAPWDSPPFVKRGGLPDGVAAVRIISAEGLPDLPP